MLEEEVLKVSGDCYRNKKYYLEGNYIGSPKMRHNDRQIQQIFAQPVDKRGILVAFRSSLYKFPGLLPRVVFEIFEKNSRLGMKLNYT